MSKLDELDKEFDERFKGWEGGTIASVLNSELAQIKSFARRYYLLGKSEEREALKEIDDLVSSDIGFEADLITGEMSKAETIKESEFAKVIMQIYKITHPKLHDCCKTPPNPPL